MEAALEVDNVDAGFSPLYIKIFYLPLLCHLKCNLSVQTVQRAIDHIPDPTQAKNARRTH